LLDHDFDAYLSYDLDDFMGVNHYLPIWICRLGPTTKDANEKQIRLTQGREVLALRPKNFAMVASNPEQFRGHFISSLHEIMEIEVFGKLGQQILNKDETLRLFNFNICFENDLYPGYVTEKVVEAYLSGCIPIWRGLDAGGFINKEAIIDVTDMSVADAVQEVCRISRDYELMAKMKSAPLLKKTIPLDQLIENLRNQYQGK
jgi:hypothetical protein